MEVVARHDVGGGKALVMIDDPVSSLDSNVFMGISTYIWTHCVGMDHIAQLFLLTHNFELFRQWDVQLEALHKGRGMKTRYPAELYEITSRYSQARGAMNRQPRLTSWPPSEATRKKVRSTYHHAFMTVAEAKDQLEESDDLEHRLNAQLLFPNVIRRMLEAFLGFKMPDAVGDFTGMMRETTQLLKTSGYPGDADALRQQLTRYVHAHSHSESPDTTVTMSPDEIAPAILAVFKFMHHMDPGHFNGLCKAVGRDAQTLLEADEKTTERSPLSA
jgi:wobble nucleotide-excising tRNase